MSSLNKARISIAIALTIIVHAATTARDTKQPTKKKTSIADQFYKCHGSSAFWYNNETDNLRNGVLSLVDSAAYLGIDKRKYSFPGSNGLRPASSVMESDRKFTESFIDFIRDVYNGADINRQISNDEVSGKYNASADSFILSWLCGLNSYTDIRSYLRALEPGDSVYSIIKQELRLQLDSGNTAKVKSLSLYINAYRWIKHFHFGKYIVANIPAAYLSAYNNGRLELGMKIVVGKPTTRTPRFATWCDKVILYPYWNVPRSIAVKELLPVFKRSPERVTRMNMQIIGRNGKQVDPHTLNWASFTRSNFPYTIRQCTGCDNSLGVVKFNLTDPFDVYMHDTNFKIAFGSAKRYYSHGCIRVEQPIELGNYLLDNKIDSNFLKACLKGQQPVVNDIIQPVPVFVVYLTADVVNGMVEYYKDIYHLYSR